MTIVLLLVCWYCHKRGKEARLEKERAVTEAEMEAIQARIAADEPGEYTGPRTTTAPEGASLEEVQAGMYEAAEAAQSGEAEYAEGGSLARSMREEKAQEEAEKGQYHESGSGSTKNA